MERPKVALALIVAARDAEAQPLDRLLGGDMHDLPVELKKVDLSKTDGIAKHVDAIYITITGENELVQKVAEKYGAIISHMPWENDFAKARNFNFSQVPSEYEYIVWTDADDMWENPHLIRDVAAKMKEETVDYVNLHYMYHFNVNGDCDAQHRKTRIIRNDGSFIWIGNRVHEDFAPTRQTLGMDNMEMRVLHMTNDARIASAQHRNLQLAREAFNENQEDPRSHWNLANAMVSVGMHSEGIQYFLSFLDTSKSDDERSVAWCRIAECYASTGDGARAVSCVLESLSMRPWFPDAYFLLGKYNMMMGRYRHAREFIEMGLGKTVPELELVVWNPMQYEYYPRLQLAEVLLRLSKPKDAMAQMDILKKRFPDDKKVKELSAIIEPELSRFAQAEEVFEKAKVMTDKEEIRKLIDGLPNEMRYYPPIINLRNKHFTKTESSGRDVVIYCGHTDHEWSPEVFSTKGVGGSEEAVIQLAKRWAASGWNVSVYASTPGFREYEFDGVKWMPYMAWNYRDKQDVVVIWRHPRFAEFQINSPVVLVDVHDVVPPNEFTQARLNNITGVVFKSRVHRDFYSNIPDSKAIVIPHGLDVSMFDERRSIVKKNPYKVINTSSPDRGLLTCIDIIKRVHSGLSDDLKPKLKFRWNYGFRIWDTQFSDDEQMLAWKKKALDGLEELRQLGVLEDGSGDMISQDAIVDQYLESGVILYPSTFFEIGFISGMKGILGGAIPATTDVFAQGEFLTKGMIVHSDADYNNWVVDVKSGVDFGVQSDVDREMFAGLIIEYMKDPSRYDEMRDELVEYAHGFTWDGTASNWVSLFNK